MVSIVGKWGVPGVNENGECLVDLCSERGLFLSNTYFEHKLIHRYTWRRVGGNEEQKGLIDYIAVDERLRKDVIDARVVRGMFPDSDHYAVLTKVRPQVVWRWKGEKKVVKTRVAKERLNDECVRANYKESIGRAWNGVMGNMNVDENVDNLFERMAVEVNSVVEEVCGIKKIIGNRNRGDAW